MNKKFLALPLMAVLALSTIGPAVTLNYAYFQGKNGSGSATVTSSGYNSCNARITDPATKDTFFLSHGTADLSSGFECTGDGGIIHADGTIEHGTAHLEADSTSATIEVNSESVSTPVLRFRLV